MLCAETDIIPGIRKGRVRWVGHVERITEETTVKKVFKNKPERKKHIENQEREGWTTLKKSCGKNNRRDDCKESVQE